MWRQCSRMSPRIPDRVSPREAHMNENIVTDLWPELLLDAWKDTYATLHMWTQIVGKVRKTLTPLINHWWNVTLYVNSRGLTTSPIPLAPIG